MDPQPNPTPAPEKKRTLFETVLTSTPVLLTVVATFMVGQSTGEMTRAQYNRTVAGQNQSKVSNQWAFFQALRMRGTTYEVSADIFAATREPVAISKDSFDDSVKRLAEATQSTLKFAAPPSDKNAEGGIKQAEKEMLSSLNRLQDCLEKGFTAGKYTTTPKQIETSFVTMKEFIEPKLAEPLNKKEGNKEKKTKDESPTGDKKSESKKAVEDMSEQEVLEEVVKEIYNRKTEKELAPLVIKISDDFLHKAIAKADTDAKQVSDKGKKAENVLEQLDFLVDNLAYATRKYLRTYDRIPHSAEEEKKAKQQADALRAQMEQLETDYKTARHLFTKNRYERNARGNQKSAELYEVNVYLAGAKSDRHMERSKNFMIAMLVAQVGVIIASMAMAVKQKSLVWSLATLAGLVAIGFGAYVYVGMQ